jgi:predicted secreted protein
MRLYALLLFVSLACKTIDSSSDAQKSSSDPAEDKQTEQTREDYHCSNETNTPKYDISIHLGDDENERRGSVNGYPIAPGVDVDPIPFKLAFMTENDREKFLKKDGQPRKRYDLLTHSCEGAFADAADLHFSVDVYEDFVVIREMHNEPKTQKSGLKRTLYLKRLVEEPAPFDLSFVVAVGETFEIKLSSTPSTGYKWQIENLDPKLLTLESENFIAVPNGPAGSGGEQFFTLKGLAVGVDEVELIYKRPWESSIGETKKVKVEIVP